MVVQIKGSNWTINLLTRKKYEKKYGADDQSDGTCSKLKKEIDFHQDGFSPQTVRHELLHAFFGESNTYSANLDPQQMEELACEIFEQHAIDILKLADEILTKFLID
jgi:hypothetical protein